MYLLENPTRSYSWGSRTVIPDLLGRAVSDDPQAELWIGAHPDSPSGIVNGKPDLDLLTEVRLNPRGLLGERAHEAFGDRLPYLLKFLAIERPLSLQVHPDQRDAVVGYAEASNHPPDGRVFKDPHHKPELVYAVSEFHALCGFRPVEQSHEVFAFLAGRTRGIHAFARAAHLLEGSDSFRALRETCTYVANLGQDEVAAAVESLSSVAANHPDDVLAVVSKIAETYPGDRAILLSLLLRHIVLDAGDTLGVEPGTPHTYLRGAAVELTTCSDNTIRAGITSKSTDIGQFIDVLDFRRGRGSALHRRQVSDAECSFTTGHSEFELSVVRLSAGVRVRWAPKPRTVLVLDGAVTLTDGSESATLTRGQSVFIPANAGVVEISGDGRAVQATTGI